MTFSGVDGCHNPRGRKARLARKWFAVHGPADMQPLPLGYCAREDLKRGGIDHIRAWYAASLACSDYDVEQHPSAEAFGRGVMASEFAPDFITKNEALRKRFPPCPLLGLGPALVWEPPKVHA
jgi:hypothetical protein